MILAHRVILITGAAGGLGSTAAIEFARQGAIVILLDKNLPKLEKIYDAILEQGGIEPILYPFDLAGASENDYSELAQRIDEKYGMLHGLVHAAVELSAFTPLIQFGTKDWGHTFNVNVNAPFILTRELLPVMQKAPKASIVFISDSSARQAPAYSGAYGVSKVALEGLASVLSQELEGGQKIRVNTLIPSPIDSPLRRRVYPAEDKSLLPSMASLNPIFCYLLSDESIDVTGQLIDAQLFLN